VGALFIAIDIESDNGHYRLQIFTIFLSMLISSTSVNLSSIYRKEESGRRRTENDNLQIADLGCWFVIFGFLFFFTTHSSLYISRSTL